MRRVSTWAKGRPRGVLQDLSAGAARIKMGVSSLLRCLELETALP